ncbi:30S ribosomal protein S15 [Candidatus Neomarinimicrobiota bacterium]
MPLSSEKKLEIIKEHGESENDTGSTGVQIALLTVQIRELTEHFKIHKKDHHGRRGLVMMVSKRRSLLKYLKRTDLNGYGALIKKLDLRH